MSIPEQSPADEPVAPGAALRKVREQAGIALELVAQRTMIPLSRLRALENDDYERVGVATFVIGYVRAYAKFLGVDPAPLLNALEPSLPKAESAPIQLAPSVALALHVQKRPRSFFWPAIIIMVVILGVVAFIGINTVLVPANEPATVPVRPVSDLVERENVALPLEVTVEAPVDEQPGEASEEVLEVIEEESLADTDFALTPSPLPSQTAAPPERVEVANEPLITNAQGSSDELTLAFTEDCWVEVTDATGKALIARLATSGDNLQLFGQAPFQVVLGNAPAASVALNGQPIEAVLVQGRKFKRLTVGE
jgi:cytoskeleton protein RodZ